MIHYVLDEPERPRERLLRTGTVTLGDKELLAIVLGSGTRGRPAPAVAAELLRRAGGVPTIARASAHELRRIRGVGAAQATRIAAAFELGRRAVDHAHFRATLACPEDVYRVVAPRFQGLTQEAFVAVGLDMRNRVLDISEVARGSLASVEVHPREVFRPLIRMGAAGAVVAHNHPSGDPSPSQSDLDLTRALRRLGAELGIPIVDHVILGDRAYTSACEWLGGSKVP